MAEKASYDEKKYQGILQEGFRLRYQEPDTNSVRVLRQIFENIKKDEEFLKRNFLDLAFIVQEVLRLCFEDNIYAKDAMKECKEIIAVLKKNQGQRNGKNQSSTPNPKKTSQSPSSADTKMSEIFSNAAKLEQEFPLLSLKVSPRKDEVTEKEREKADKLKHLRELVEDVVAKYRKKWNTERAEDYVDAKLSDEARKKIVITVQKHEDYALRRFEKEFKNFEEVLPRLSDDNEVENMLRSVESQLVQLKENVEKFELDRLAKLKNCGEESCNAKNEEEETHSREAPSFPQNTPGVTEYDYEEDCLVQDMLLNEIFTKCEENKKVESDSPSKNDDGPKIVIRREAACDINRIFEIEFKPFVYNKPAEKLISISSNKGAAYYDFSQIWNEKSRWSNMKYKLLKKGTIETGNLRLCLPLYRNEFVISNGSFGPVELAFLKNYDCVTVKRVTEFGWSEDYCVEIRQNLKKLHRVENVNLLHSFLTQVDLYHRHTLLHYELELHYDENYLHNEENVPPMNLCEYNLEEYIPKLKEEDRLPASSIKELCKQFIRGMVALHVNVPAIKHGNLKLSNVLVDDRGVLKVSGFGFSKQPFGDCFKLPSGDCAWFPSMIPDLQACGPILFYINSGGHQLEVKACDNILEYLQAKVADLKVASLEFGFLLISIISGDPGKMRDIIEVANNIYFWSDEKKTEFLTTCLSISNEKFEPIRVSSVIAKKFCATLSESWSTNATNYFWMPSAFKYFPGAQIPHGTSVNSGIGLLQFLNKCRHDNPDLFNTPGLVLQAYPELPCMIYQALRGTNWFMRDDLKKFAPNYFGGDCNEMLTHESKDSNK